MNAEKERVMNEYTVRYRQTQTVEVTIFAESPEDAARRVQRDDIPADNVMDGCNVLDWEAPVIEHVVEVEA